MKSCKLSRLRWAGHVIRQDDDDLSRRVFLSEPGGKCLRGRPRLRWEHGVNEGAAKLGCRRRKEKEKKKKRRRRKEEEEKKRRRKEEQKKKRRKKEEKKRRRREEEEKKKTERFQTNRFNNQIFVNIILYFSVIAHHTQT